MKHAGTSPAVDSSLAARRRAGPSTMTYTRDPFVGNSEMARRMRALDWSQTSLGDVSTWPQNLRAAVGICVESRFPLAIYWGTDATLLYNDRWSPILGDKHPWALGRPAVDVWPEIWDEIGPLFDQVFSTADATDAEDAALVIRRRGSAEESCFTCTFSPIRDERATVQGVFSAVVETTHRLIAERRTALVRELGQRLAGLNSIRNVRTTAAASVPVDLAALILPHDVEHLPADELFGTAPAASSARSGQARSRELLSQVPAVVNVLSGPNLVFEFAHPLAVKASGGRQLQGRTVLDAFPEYRGQPFIEMLQHVYRTGEIISLHETSARLAGADNGSTEETYWNSMYLPVRTERGEIDGVMMFEIDVTEQVLARRRVGEQTAALTRALEAAETATRAKDEFLAMLGHELRNPLSPIVTAVQLMRLRGAEFSELSVIDRQVAHLTHLVDDLLDVSRITRGKFTLNREAIELSEVVARAIEIASPLLEQRRHSLTVNVATRGLAVDGDRERLAQVVSNLLTNAAKYSDAESRIFVSSGHVDGRLELRVRDEGLGIPPELLDTVFDAYVQQRQAIDRARGGLGLGLTIARTLVNLHGGTIRAESAGPGYGSDFIIELPLSTLRDAAIEAEAGPRISVAPPRGPRVLVVDDNADTAEMLTQVLQCLGYDVATAHDGPSALERARTFRADVALLDIGLPVMDGYELADRLRTSDDGTPGPTLIAVTGYGQEADRNRTATAGFAHHLVKPINIQELSSLLERVLAQC